MLRAKNPLLECSAHPEVRNLKTEVDRFSLK